jgi:hypothetical protein
VTSPTDKTRPPPARRGYAPLKATRPAANSAKSEVSRPAITPTDISHVAHGPPVADLPGMEARFAADFADGLMGRLHNTFQHRSRVLRQLAEDESGS